MRDGGASAFETEKQDMMDDLNIAPGETSFERFLAV